LLSLQHRAEVFSMEYLEIVCIVVLELFRFSTLKDSK